MEVKTYTTLKNIPNSNYEGYVWMSDCNEPIILNGNQFDFNAISINPFIIEALLFDQKSNTSIHIIHNGDYLISEYTFNNVEHIKIENIEYLPHRLKNVEKVLFKQIWEEVIDSNCNNFPVYTHTATVFGGFKKK